MRQRRVREAHFAIDDLARHMRCGMCNKCRVAKEQREQE